MAISTWAMIQWNDFKILSNTIDRSKESFLRDSSIWRMTASSRKERPRSWWRKTRHSPVTWDKETESSTTWEPSKIFKNSSCSWPLSRLRGSFEKRQLRWSSLRGSLPRKGKRMTEHRTSRIFRSNRQENIRLRSSRKMSPSWTISKLFCDLWKHVSMQVEVPSLQVTSLEVLAQEASNPPLGLLGTLTTTITEAPLRCWWARELAQVITNSKSRWWRACRRKWERWSSYMRAA